MGGGGKETPRQKMIGMMYLVLTAMLALNVSKSVLDAFVLIDDGLMRTTLNFVEKNQSVYDIFDAQFDLMPTSVGPPRAIANSVKRRADSLAFVLQEYKAELVRMTDGDGAAALEPMEWVIGHGENRRVEQTFNVHTLSIQGKDNKDRGAQLFFHSTPGQDNQGTILKGLIDDYREFLVENTKDSVIKSTIRDLLSTEPFVDPRTNAVEPWVEHNFTHLPMVAVVTNLTLMQSQVRNAEAEIAQYLLNQIGASDTRVNKMEAVVLTRTNYVMQGGQFEARVMLAAYDSLQRPDIYLGRSTRTEDGNYVMADGGRGIPLEYDSRGRAMILRPASSVGNFTVEGLLEMITPEGTRNFPWSIDYTVGAQSTVISATQMNAMYVGVENPVSILMAGVPPEQIQASMTNGTIRRQGNNWVASPTAAGRATITATATVDGAPQRGQMEFRVMMLPSPSAQMGGRSGGNIERNTLANQVGMVASMGDFLFDLRYTITQFNVEAMVNQMSVSEASTSAALTAAQRDLINRVPRGQRVTFSNIRARGSHDNRIIPLNDISFTVQ